MAANTGANSQGPWTFDRVLRMLHEQGRSGILEVTGPDGEWAIHLRKGYISFVEARGGGTWLLGELLVHSGAVRADVLERLQRKAQEQNRRVEDLLVESKLVSPDLLRRMLEVEVRETVVPLFSRVGITCRFREEPPVIPAEFVPIPVPSLLRDAQRRTAERPIVDKLVPSVHSVFRKVPGKMGEVFGTALDTAAIEAAKTHVEGQAFQLGSPLTASDRIVFHYVNGKKTVAQVAAASGLGAHETMKALARLLHRGCIELVEETGKGEEPAPRTLWPFLVNAAVGLLLAALAAGVVALRIVAPHGLQGLPAFEAAHTPPVRNAGRRLRTAIAAYALRHAQLPASLDAVFAAEALDGRDRHPIHGSGTWRYRIVDAAQQRYTLEWGAAGTAGAPFAGKRGEARDKANPTTTHPKEKAAKKRANDGHEAHPQGGTD